MVTRISIEETKQLAVDGIVNELTNTGQSEQVLGTQLAQTSGIDTYAQSVIFIQDQDQVLQPFWVVDLHHEANSYALSYVFTNGAVTLVGEAVEEFASPAFHPRDNQGVFGEFPWYTWHIRRLVREDVPIQMEELNERAFLFLFHADPGLRPLGRIAGLRIKNKP